MLHRAPSIGSLEVDANPRSPKYSLNGANSGEDARMVQWLQKNRILIDALTSEEIARYFGLTLPS